MGFAAAFLTPAEDIHDQLPATAGPPTLFALKRQRQVSPAALLMRARTPGRMSENTCLTAIKAASARGGAASNRPPGRPAPRPPRLCRRRQQASPNSATGRAPSAVTGLVARTIAQRIPSAAA
ncbi:ImmA/IrrE family metallo-endopeptidase [Streptomyces sp. NPDC088253]|uniref:ImmA/IrrE family metallo-endopeptidase n=1 Tax=Streptomyces sp. NPDC088253 TaxID=3365846 RepID=UPI00382E47A8